MKPDKVTPAIGGKSGLFHSENGLTDWLAGNILTASVIAVVGVLLILNFVIPAFAGRRRDAAHSSAPAAVGSSNAAERLAVPK